ncbi:MAG TPA: T9SS type A sorting domain-containing protein, partial [Ignavibacteriaceae bacterium]
ASGMYGTPGYLNDIYTKAELENNLIPTEFVLYQNYPNPFNPSTKISWQSPLSGWQTLKVYDILGNEVATLINEYRNAGSYEIDFNPASSINNLPAGRQGPASGIYFYQLRVGDPSTGSGQGFVETKKMILLK